MPKSKLRKNHKQKVEAWKTKNEQITKSFNKKLREALLSNKPDSENGGVRIQVDN
jgi:hypothetical protein